MIQPCLSILVIFDSASIHGNRNSESNGNGGISEINRELQQTMAMPSVDNADAAKIGSNGSKGGFTPFAG